MDPVIDAGAAAPANETLAPVIYTGTQADTSQTNAAPSLDDDLQAVWSKLHPKREGDGKFAGADGKTEGAEPGDTAKSDSAGQPETVSTEPAKPAIDAPQSWPAEAKAKWASVPPELQTIVAKRETEAHQAITRLGTEKQQLEQQIRANEPLDQLIQANKTDFARRGVTPAQAFSVLLNAQSQLDTDPVAGLVQIGLSYGIDLRPAFQGQQQNGIDPKTVQLENTVRRLEQQLAQQGTKITERETVEQTRQREAENAQNVELSKTIETFKKDKPYFEEVRPLMARLLTPAYDASGNEIAPASAQNLEDAYDMAVNAKPDIRQRIQTDQRKADEEKRTADAKAKAEAARKAASVNVRGSSSSPNPKTMDDDLQEIARRAYG